jgi:hypothetical protein
MCGAIALLYGFARLEAIRPDDMHCFGTNISDEEEAVCYLVAEKDAEEGGSEKTCSVHPYAAVLL